MKLRVSNLGRLKQAEFEIKPLTVFIGPNHTNKTWTAYSLYGLARRISSVHYPTRERTYVVSPSAGLQSRVQSAVQRVAETVQRSSGSEVRARVTRRDVLGDVLPDDLCYSCDRRAIATILGIAESELGGQPPQAQLIVDPDEFEDPIFDALEIILSRSPAELRVSLFNRDGSMVGETTTMPLFETAGAESPTEGVALQIVNYLETGFRILTDTILSNAIVLPAERKTLLSIDLRLSLYEMTTKLFEGFATPALDFLLMIDDARRRRTTVEEGTAPFADLADTLDDQVLRGKILFPEDELNRTTRADAALKRPRALGAGKGDLVRYSADEGVELAMHASSSIVRSLAGLDVYLRTYARRGDLIIIDEPEMNAHPEAQLKIIELLALLAHHGIRVVITTHSPYIVDHLSNLMQASQLTDAGQEGIVPKFKLGIKEAFLTPAQVSTYLFTEAGTVEDLLDREQGIIDLSSFSDPTEYMQNLVNEIWRMADSDVGAAREPSNAV